MTTSDDALAAALDQYLAYLEEGGEAPTFEDLSPDLRRELEGVIADLHAARGIDPHASRPSVETLVAGTEFEDMFRGTSASNPSLALDEVRNLLASLGDSCRMERAADEEGHGLIVRRRDLVIYLFVQAGTQPVLDAEARRRAVGIFAKPSVARVCVVASAGPEYLTQWLSAADLGLQYTSPAGTRKSVLADVLPVEMAVKQLLETCAPEWEPVGVSTGSLDSTPAADVALPIVRELVEREAGRAYRGDKARAYRGLVGSETTIVDVISAVATAAEPFDPEAAVAAILGEAA